MPIYTKTGDGGKSSTIKTKNLAKDSPIFGVLGTIDELNASVGLATSYLGTSPILRDIKIILSEIQCDLFSINSTLAGGEECVTEGKITTMEKIIDVYTNQLPVLNNFILPGGSVAAGQLHFARTVCRRAERLLVHYTSDKPELSPILIKYMNRLSDLLFTLARVVNKENQTPDILWKTN